MKMHKDLFSELYNKKVEIYTKNIGTIDNKRFTGVVVGCYSSDETFLVLDTKELINVRYIAIIKIID